MRKPETIKVCHFSSAHPNDDVRIFLKECATLAEAGFEVYLVTANGEEGMVNGVRRVTASVPPSGRFSRMLNTSRAVYRKALSLDCDIYHFHDPELLPYGLKLRRKGKKVIYDAHEDVPKQILGKFWINKYLRKTVSASFRTYENYVARRLSYIFTATPFIRDRFLEVNPCTIDINNFPLLSELPGEASWTDKKPEICYLGGITRVRGIEELIDTLSSLPDVKLNLAGSFSPAALEDEMKAKEAWKQVNFYGFVSRKETGEIMARSMIGMVTLHPLPNYIDSQPIKMFEYMSAGIPVIGSDFPLWRKILVDLDCGVCVDPNDPKAIAGAVRTLLDDPARAQEMGRNGRKAVVGRYNWTPEGEKMIAAYLGMFSENG